MAKAQTTSKKATSKKGKGKQLKFNAVQLNLTDEQREALSKAFGPDFVKKLQGILVSNVSGRLTILGNAN